MAGTESKAAGVPSLALTVAHSKGPPPGLRPAVRPPPPVTREDRRSEKEQWAAYNQGDNYEPDP
eukprot:15447954-Alexandrium_andersonii.AAC.1